MQYMIRYGSRVSGAIRSSYWKESLRVALDYSRQFYLIGMLGGREDIESSLHSPKTNINVSVSVIYKQRINERKDKVDPSQEYLICTCQVALWRKNTQTRPMLGIYSNYFINKQNVEGVQNGEKS